MAAKETKVYVDTDAAISFAEGVGTDAQDIKRAVGRLIDLYRELQDVWRTDGGKDELAFRQNLIRGYEQLLADADDLILFATKTIQALKEYTSLGESVRSRVRDIADLTDPGNG